MQGSSGKHVLQVKAKDAVVLATGTPITNNLVDSSVRAISVHGKQVLRRRCVPANFCLLCAHDMFCLQLLCCMIHGRGCISCAENVRGNAQPESAPLLKQPLSTFSSQACRRPLVA